MREGLIPPTANWLGPDPDCDPDCDLGVTRREARERPVRAAQSLMEHGFKRFIIYSAHGGNRVVCQYIADRINHETHGIAVTFQEAAAPFLPPLPASDEPRFDRHAGGPETSSSLYLIPELVQLERAEAAELSLPAQVQAMVPDVLAGDRTASLVFLAEALKDEKTGRGTSAREMSTAGGRSEHDPREASAEQDRARWQAAVETIVRFIQRWNNELRPVGTD